MDPEQEFMDLVPKHIAQVSKQLKILARIQTGPEEINPALLAEYEKEKATSMQMDARFKELSEMVRKMKENLNNK